MQFRAILRDSLRQALDRKALFVLLLAALLPILFCLGISLEPRPIDDAIRKVAARLPQLSYRVGLAQSNESWGVTVSVGEVSPLRDADGWPEDVRGGHAVEVSFGGSGLDTLVKAWRRIERSIAAGRHLPADPAASEAPVTAEERLRFLEARFLREGFQHAHARAPAAPEGSYRVALAGNPVEIRRGHTLGLLFGQVEVPLEDTSAAEFVLQLELGLAEFFAGFVAMLIALSATSSFVPDMLRKGSLDLLLARPIGRTRLLLYKYLGGLWFIGLFAALLVGGCWLALWARTGVSSPWFLASAVTVVATFAVLYSVSVLFGVLTRSSGVAMLLAAAVWGSSSMIAGVRNNLASFFFDSDPPALLKRSLDVLYAILPKMSDIAQWNRHVLGRAQLSSTALEGSFLQDVPKIDWAWSAGTTALFTAAMLALAAWWFRKRDY